MSEPSDPDRKGQGVVALCDEAGRVAEILCDDIGLLAITDLGLLVAAPDRPKFDELMKAAASRQPAFDRLLHVEFDGRQELLHFGAVPMGGRIIVMAAHSRAALSALSEAHLDRPPAAAASDALLYQDLTRLNNDLAATERRLIKANVQFDRANRELRALYESLPVGVFRADRTGRIEQANERFRALTGVATPDDWLSGVDPQDAERVSLLWQKALVQAEGFRIDYRRAALSLAMRVSPVRDAEELLAGFVGVVTDITERQLAEERGREIERNLAVHQLTAGLAHNLNNIMMVMLSASEQMHDDLPAGGALHLVAQRNMLATERAAKLTRQLMIYSGHGLVRLSAIAVDAALEAVVRGVAGTFTGARVLELDLASPGVAVRFNAELFDEALRELIANARAAIADGGTVRLSTTVSEDRRLVVITVADDGTGMDAATLKRAREPFFTSRAVGQGVGLGLSLADGAARLAGGRLDISSKAGRGTVVELHLPLMAAA